MEVNKRLIPISEELRKLALRVGKIFGLDIYGLAVVETLHGPVVVDINDFPSFGHVPHAVSLVSAYVLQLASRADSLRLRPRSPGGSRGFAAETMYSVVRKMGFAHFSHNRIHQAGDAGAHQGA